MVIPGFTFLTNDKEVSFKDTSFGLGTSYSWDFGDGLTDSNREPTHKYSEYGFYKIKLEVTDAEGSYAITLPLGLSGRAFDTPTIPVAAAFYDRFPEEIKNLVTPTYLNTVIRKWQKYISVFIRPTISSDVIHQELYWPTLYNDLVTDLVVIDIFESQIRNYLLLLMARSSSASSGGGSGGSTQNVKSITTGPAIVEWYDIGSTAADQLSSAGKPGGLIDQCKNTACLNAGYLHIPLEFCKELEKPYIPFGIAKKPHKHRSNHHTPDRG
jgi:hypothetical protein